MLFRLLILPVLLPADLPVSAIELKTFNLGAGYCSLQLYDEADTYDSDRLMAYRCQLPMRSTTT
jgi:hypothetical protein